MNYPNIEAARIRAHMSREALSAALNVSVGTLHRWQFGKAKVPANKLYAMSQLFNVPTDLLIGRTIINAAER